MRFQIILEEKKCCECKSVLDDNKKYLYCSREGSYFNEILLKIIKIKENDKNVDLQEFCKQSINFCFEILKSNEIMQESEILIDFYEIINFSRDLCFISEKFKGRSFYLFWNSNIEYGLSSDEGEIIKFLYNKNKNTG